MSTAGKSFGRAFRKALMTVLVMGLLAGGFAWSEVARLRSEPLPLAGSRVIEVEPGLTLRAVADRLATTGVIRDADDLVWADRLWGRGPVKAGEYAVPAGGSTLDLLRQLESGVVVLHALTIVEGTTLAELRAQLRDADVLRHTLDGVPDRDLMAALGLPAGPAEGRFLPDTYRFPRGTTDAEFLRRAGRALEAVLAEAWAGRANGLPLDGPGELLNLASLVERESGVAAERPAIAGVFVRRLRQGMRLQSDPTVIYGMGARFEGNLTRKDLMTNTPYNTYTRAGLPPTPICLPGRAAIAAAAHPAAGDALYFVATGDGGHAFSATLREHNAAVDRYLRKLRAQRGSTR